MRRMSILLRFSVAVMPHPGLVPRLLGRVMLLAAPRGGICRKYGENSQAEETRERARALVHSVVPPTNQPNGDCTKPPATGTQRRVAQWRPPPVAFWQQREKTLRAREPERGTQALRAGSFEWLGLSTPEQIAPAPYFQRLISSVLLPASYFIGSVVIQSSDFASFS